MAEQRRPPAKVDPHPLIEALVPDPAKPPERTTKLFGFPGRSPEPDTTRLWLDLDLTSYVDIPNASIRHTSTLPNDGGTVFWVAADAQLKHASVTSHAAQAEFLSGSIASAHLGAAAGAAGFGGAGAGAFPPTLIPQLCGPSLLAPCFTHGSPVCPTAAPTLFVCCQPHTLSPPCPTHVVICHPSLITPCHSVGVICKPSVATPCVSVLSLHCPTQPIICSPSIATPCHTLGLYNCPTRLCPSVAIPCQTTPGCPLPTLGCPFGGPEGGGFGG